MESVYTVGSSLTGGEDDAAIFRYLKNSGGTATEPQLAQVTTPDWKGVPSVGFLGGGREVSSNGISGDAGGTTRH